MPAWNQTADLVGIYKGIFGIYDSVNHAGTLYNYDHPVTVEVETVQDSEKFYSATGAKVKKAIGSSSRFRLRIKKTADLYHTTDPPTDIRTISYFRKKIETDREVVVAAFEGVDEADSAANKFLRQQFTASIDTILDVPRDAGSIGAQEVEITGEIISYVKPGHRQAS